MRSALDLPPPLDLGEVLSAYTDTELVDFVEKNGVQVWPQRERERQGPGGNDKIRRIPGEIFCWTAQVVLPFMQISRPKWREAVSDLKKAYEESKSSKS